MKKIVRLVLLVVFIAVFIIVLIFASSHNKDTIHANISGVIINEVMSKNDSSCPDSFGDYYDWIELYNSGSEKVNLTGCGLSDDVTGKVDYVFPTGTEIEGGGYLIVYCCGDNSMGDMYADFKLSSSDDVVLYNQGGNPVQYISLRSVEDGQSLARTGEDAWQAMSPTPGYPNTDEGIMQYAQYIANFSGNADSFESGDVVINEIMASNATVLAAKDGEFYDWIELYNRGSKDISLKGWYLSDDTQNIKKYQITDDLSIGAGEYLVIFCSGNSGMTEGELHVPFRLSAYEEAAVIADANGKISDKVTYQKLTCDWSYARNENDEFEISKTPTPGYPNNDSGFQEFQKTACVPKSDVFLSEMMGSNTTVPITHKGVTVYPDWIELYNGGSEDINLSGYALSDKPTNPAKWVFPDITIKSGGYVTVLATSVTDGSKCGGYYQTNFSVSADGDTVYLFSPEGKFLDKLTASSFIKDMSVGRSQDNKILYYSTPTFGTKNGKDGYLGQTSYPEFDVKPGIYSESVTVSIKCNEGETVYYTLDCTTPTTKSTKYTEPITVDKNTVIRAKTFRKGWFSNFSCNSGTYLFKSDNCNHALPVLTLVTDPANLWDKNTGIYTYGNIDPTQGNWPYWETPAANFWNDVEVPASFELFDENGQVAFQQNVGISISGAFGRGREQKGMAIMARDEYGNNRLNYKFFANREFTEYKSLLLRCGAQDQMNGKIRDVVSAECLRDTDVHILYQEYEPYILYLNGRYWGVYFLREKRNRFFVAQHEGLGLDNAKKLDLIKSETRANYGVTTEWSQLNNYVRTHDMTLDMNYKYVTERMDIDSFIDYLCCEIYSANTDTWNIQMYKTEDGKWKFIFYDFCWSWGTGGAGYAHETLRLRRSANPPLSDMFNALLKRSEFKDKFIRRFAVIMDTVYEKNKVLDIINRLYLQVEPEIKREREIFNSSSSPYFDYVDPNNYSSYDVFINNINKIKAFAENRRGEIIKQLKSEFGLSDEYIKEVFGNG